MTYEQFINNIDKEEFLNYYRNHNIHQTASYYKICEDFISKYCKEIGYIKSKF